MTYWPHRLIDVYEHQGRIGVMVEFACESEFLTGMKSFKAMIRDITLQIAAEDPETVEQLLEQACIKDDSKRVGDFLDEIAQHFGEKVAVMRFVRWTTERTCLPCEDSPEPPPAPALIQRVG
jgi:elongation factor Ts